MSTSRSIGVVCLLAALLPTARAQWFDPFDSYALGPLAAQSDWEEWYSSTDVDADVTDAQAFSQPHSILSTGVPTTDVVYQFSHLPSGAPASGQWLASIKTFVPTGAKGDAYFIMMSRYGNPNDDNWSLQVRFHASTGKVTSDGVGHQSAPLLFGQWVSLRAFIDLDRDRVDISYGDHLLVNGESWKDGISGGGIDVIAALDLYGGPGSSGITGMYWDDASLQPARPFDVILDGGPNPASVGQLFTLTTIAPELPNAPAALFVSEVDGLPFPRLVTTGTLDTSGRWTVSGTLPPSVAHLRFSFGALAVDPTGAPALGNREVVYFE